MDILGKIIENKEKMLAGLIALIILLMFGSPVGLARLLIFLILLAITAAISYWLAAVKSPIDASPTFFLMIIINLKFGFFYALIFLILSSIAPTIIAGGEFGAASVLFSGAFLLLTLMSGLFIELGIVWTGIILSGLLIAIGFAINKIAADQGGMFMTVTHAALTIGYFAALGNLLMRI